MGVKVEFYLVEPHFSAKLAFIKLLKDFSAGLGLREAKDMVDEFCKNHKPFTIECNNVEDVKHLIKESNELGVRGRFGRKSRLHKFFSNDRKEQLLKDYLKDVYNIADDIDINFEIRQNDEIEIFYGDEYLEVDMLDILVWIYSKINGKE